MPASQAATGGMRTFFVIWFGGLISLLGSGLTSFGLGVWIFDQTKQATPFALTVLFSTLPPLLLGPLAGALADRWNRRRLMIAADTGSALVTLAAALLLWNGQLEVWHIYLIAMANGLCSAFQEPAYTASIVMLVPKEQLARASGLSQLARALEMLLAPAIAGVLFVTIGLNGIILIDFITFFFAIGALLVVKIPQPAAEALPSGARRPTLLSDAAYGWRYLTARPGLMVLLVYFALVNFLLNLSAVLTGPLVLAVGTAGMLGAVQVASGAGMLAGSIAMSAWGGPKRRVLGVIAFIALGAVGLLVAGMRPSPVFAGAGLFILLFCVPLASGPSQAIFQSKVEPAVQGRVFAMRGMISRSMMPLAFLLAGPLADSVFEPLMSADGALGSGILGQLLGAGPGRGIGLIFTLAALLLLAASAAAWLSPRLRRIEEDLPDVVVAAKQEPHSPAAIGQAAEAV